MRVRRFLAVACIDCGLGGSLKGHPAKLAVAPGGSAIIVAPRWDDPVVGAAWLCKNLSYERLATKDCP